MDIPFKLTKNRFLTTSRYSFVNSQQLTYKNKRKTIVKLHQVSDNFVSKKAHSKFVWKRGKLICMPPALHKNQDLQITS